jgi:hypothetical protein
MTKDKKLTDVDLEQATGAGLTASKAAAAGQLGETGGSGAASDELAAQRARNRELAPGEMEGVKGGTTAPRESDRAESKAGKLGKTAQFPGGPSVK